MPEESAAGVFTQVVNNGGWSNGTTCVVDQATIIYTVVHIGNILRAARSECFFENVSAEEVQDASFNVPRAM
jgi:hypothetical protein